MTTLCLGLAMSTGQIIAAAVLAAGVGYALGGDGLSALSVNASKQCDIKGNVSIDTGERIYHVRGQKHYEQTRIRPEYGEEWFCSEAEARAAGWRKSRV